MLLFTLRRCLMLSILFACTQVKAQGDLLITPKRLVFDGSKRMEEINLANTGKDTATYSISFVQYKMDDEGKFQPVAEDDSTQKFAHKNLRFYPRTVTLGPNEAQSIKVQLLRANELAPGEYRSHLYFRSIETKSNQPQQKSLASADSGISIQLTPVFGITIPLIIRNAVSEVTGTFTDANISWENNLPVLNISLQRKGDISLYGDITVNHIATNGKVSRVGYVKGMAVYVPNSKRNLHLPLSAESNINFKSGKLSIMYTDQSPRATKICETEISL
jgi:P pilus assembly chaperone PapD